MSSLARQRLTQRWRSDGRW